MTTPRELILDRLVSAISAVVPGAVFSFPGGAEHAPISTDLGGRVYLRQQPAARLNSEQFPAVEVVADMTAPETFTASDRDLYFGKMAVSILGYDCADDAGDGLDSLLRPKLNAMRADLIIACHAAPFWPSPSSPESLRSRLGSAFVLRLMEQWAEPGFETSAGACLLELVATYPINGHRRN